MPDRCGAFFHDVTIARAFQARGHSVFFVVVGSKLSRNGVYRGIPFMHYEIAGNELARTDLWSTPHSPILRKVRKLNEQFEKPLVVNMHYGEDTLHVEHCVRNGTWAEFLWYVSEHVKQKVESTKTIASSFVETRVFNPAFIENELVLYNQPNQPQGDCITLINANMLKGLLVFVEMAKLFPNRKFLGVKPYYNAIQVPSLPNIEWIEFQEDIRNVLSRTRILMMPSVYESWGRVAFEAMYNGIPLLYTRPMVAGTSWFSTGSTEGMQAWIGNNAFACDRTNPDDWITCIQKLDDPEIYKEFSRRAFDCTHNMDAFSEIPTVENKFTEYAMKYVAPSKTKSEVAPPATGINKFMTSGMIRAPRIVRAPQPVPQPVPQSVPQPVPQPVPPPAPRYFSLRGGRFGMRR